MSINEPTSYQIPNLPKTRADFEELNTVLSKEFRKELLSKFTLSKLSDVIRNLEGHDYDLNKMGVKDDGERQVLGKLIGELSNYPNYVKFVQHVMIRIISSCLFDNSQGTPETWKKKSYLANFDSGTARAPLLNAVSFLYSLLTPLYKSTTKLGRRDLEKINLKTVAQYVIYEYKLSHRGTRTRPSFDESTEKQVMAYFDSRQNALNETNITPSQGTLQELPIPQPIPQQSTRVQVPDSMYAKTFTSPSRRQLPALEPIIFPELTLPIPQPIPQQSTRVQVPDSMYAKTFTSPLRRQLPALEPIIFPELTLPSPPDYSRVQSTYTVVSDTVPSPTDSLTPISTPKATTPTTPTPTTPTPTPTTPTNLRTSLEQALEALNLDDNTSDDTTPIPTPTQTPTPTGTQTPRPRPRPILPTAPPRPILPTAPPIPTVKSEYPMYSPQPAHVNTHVLHPPTKFTLPSKAELGFFKPPSSTPALQKVQQATLPFHNLGYVSPYLTTIPNVRWRRRRKSSCRRRCTTRYRSKKRTQKSKRKTKKKSKSRRKSTGRTNATRRRNPKTGRYTS